MEDGYEKKWLANLEPKAAFWVAFSRYVNNKYVFNHLPWAWMSVKHIKNFYRLPALFSGSLEEAELHFRDGSTFIARKSSFRDSLHNVLGTKERHPGKYFKPGKFLDSVEFDFQKRRVRLEGLGSLVGSTLFFEDDYGFLDVKGKTVLDIGANVADSSIYFAIRGAGKVIGYEPFPQAFEAAENNVKINRLGSVIEMVNAGVGKEDSFIQIGSGTGTALSNQISDGGNGKRVPILSLKSMVERHKLSGAILKMDCEGAEYDSILNADNSTLARFDKMAIEYHYGYVNLVAKLREAGFRTRQVGRPIYLYQKSWKQPHARIGVIFAERIK